MVRCKRRRAVLRRQNFIEEFTLTGRPVGLGNSLAMISDQETRFAVGPDHVLERQGVGHASEFFGFKALPQGQRMFAAQPLPIGSQPALVGRSDDIRLRTYELH